jgi:hypothetical protein
MKEQNNEQQNTFSKSIRIDPGRLVTDRVRRGTSRANHCTDPHSADTNAASRSTHCYTDPHSSHCM